MLSKRSITISQPEMAHVGDSLPVTGWLSSVVAFWWLSTSVIASHHLPLHSLALAFPYGRVPDLQLSILSGDDLRVIKSDLSAPGCRVNARTPFVAQPCFSQ